MVTQEKKDLFKWLLDTKVLLDKNVISEDVGNNILNQHLPQFSDFDERMELLDQIFHNGAHTNQLDFWCKHFIKNDDELLRKLEIMMQSKYDDIRLINVLAERFLEIPEEKRKTFYQRNFTKLTPSVSETKEVATVCGVTNMFFSNTFHHNLVSLLLKKEGPLSDEKLNNLIIEDCKKILNKEEFRQIVIPSLIIWKGLKNTKEHWEEWNIDNDKELQGLVGLQFFKRSRTNVDNNYFLRSVESDLVPYDIALSNDKHIMTLCVKSSISTIFDKLQSEIVTKIEEITKPMEEAINNLRRASVYDLYFLDKDLFTASLKHMEEINKIGKSARNLSLKTPEMQKIILDFTLVLSDLNNSVSAVKVKEKKIKL